MTFSIQKRLFFWLLVLALPITAACVITVNLVKSSLTERVIASLENDHRLETARIESALDQYKRYASGLANNRNIRTAFDHSAQAGDVANDIQLSASSGSAAAYRESQVALESDSQLRSLITEVSSLAQTIDSGVVEFKISSIDGSASAQTEGYTWKPADKAVVERAVKTQQPVFGDAFLNPDNDARLGIAVPILADVLPADELPLESSNKNGQIVSGIMTIEMKLGPVVDLVEAHEGMGETSESHIAQPTPDGDAQFITLLRFKRDAAFNVVVPKSRDKPINWSLESPETHVVRSPDYRNIDSFLAIGTVADTGWGLVVKIDEAEAFVPLYEVTSLIWKAGIASVLLIIFSWYILIRPLACRLQSTAIAADRLAAGDYDQLIEDASFDEIGVVSNSIDQLASDLKADKLLREKYEKSLKFQAEHDALTGLFNRKSLQDIAEQLDAVRSRVTFSVLFMDLDGFKAVNDQHGHHIGDEILIQFAAELNIILPKDSFAARWGGDEFVVILPCAQKKVAQELSHLISDRFEKPFSTSAGKKYLGCSIGISTSNKAYSVADCVEIADAKMYETKQERKRENDKISRAVNIVSAGLKDDRIDVWYQPIVATKLDDNYELVGAEALLHIRDKSGRRLLSDEYLPYIHEHEVAIELDSRIISQAFMDLGSWQRSALVGQDFYLSVNLCGATVQMESLPELLLEKLSPFQISPDNIVIELSAETRNIKNATLRGIRELGFKIAVDDIGLLNSNLDRLASAEPHIAKLECGWLNEAFIDPAIDKTCKVTERKKIVLKNILAICRQLGTECIIEGVENYRHLAMSREFGIKQFQGILFDHPLTAEQFSRKLEEEPPSLWYNGQTQYRKTG